MSKKGMKVNKHNTFISKIKRVITDSDIYQEFILELKENGMRIKLLLEDDYDIYFFTSFVVSPINTDRDGEYLLNVYGFFNELRIDRNDINPDMEDIAIDIVKKYYKKIILDSKCK